MRRGVKESQPGSVTPLLSSNESFLSLCRGIEMVTEEAGGESSHADASSGISGGSGSGNGGNGGVGASSVNGGSTVGLRSGQSESPVNGKGVAASSAAGGNVDDLMAQLSALNQNS